MADQATIGSNSAGLATDIAAFEEACARLAREGVTAENITLFGKAKGDDVRLRKAIEADKAAKKKPHLEANKVFDAEANGLLDRVAKALGPLVKALAEWDRLERQRREKEAEAARKAAEDAARAAAELAAKAKEEESDPFAEFEAEVAQATAIAREVIADSRTQAATERVKIANADGGRSVSWKSTWSAEIEDPAKLVAHYASRQSVIDAALACASAEMRASKGQAIIPGAKAKENRSLA